ncbi:MAG TPA: hypothetical protein PK299_12155 [Anaerolineales bacterium]|nr:hypothetical protein [Anaerolineales bacterium]
MAINSFLKKLLSKLKRDLDSVINPAYFLDFVGVLVIFLNLALYISRFGENIIWGDEQAYIGILQHLSKPNWTLIDFIKVIFRPYIAHFGLFTNLKIASLILFAHYNHLIGIWINVLWAILSFYLLIKLYLLTNQRWQTGMGIFFAIFVFSIHQDFNWLFSQFGFWQESVTLFLASLYVYYRNPKQQRNVFVAIILAVLCTFSTTNSLVVWGLLFLLAWFSNQRKPTVLLLILICGIASTYFLWLSYQAIGSDLFTSSRANLNQLWLVLLFIPLQIGGLLISRSQSFIGTEPAFWVAFIIFILSVIWLCITIFILYREKKYKTILLWGVVGLYALFTSMMVGIGRVSVANKFDFHHFFSTFQNRPFIAWYATPIQLYWIAIFALSLSTQSLLQENSGKFQKKFLHVTNSGFTALFIFLFVLQNVQTPNSSFVSRTAEFQISGTPLTRNCIEKFVYFLEKDCLGEWYGLEKIYAVYQIAIFSELPPKPLQLPNILPSDGIVIYAKDVSDAFLLETWRLDAATQDVLVVVTNHDSETITKQIALSEHLISEPELGEVLQNFLSTHEHNWLIDVNEIENDIPKLDGNLHLSGYRLGTPQPIEEYPASITEIFTP